MLVRYDEGPRARPEIVSAAPSDDAVPPGELLVETLA